MKSKLIPAQPGWTLRIDEDYDEKPTSSFFPVIAWRIDNDYNNFPVPVTLYGAAYESQLKGGPRPVFLFSPGGRAYGVECDGDNVIFNDNESTARGAGDGSNVW